MGSKSGSLGGKAQSGGEATGLSPVDQRKALLQQQAEMLQGIRPESRLALQHRAQQLLDAKQVGAPMTRAQNSTIQYIKSLQDKGIAFDPSTHKVHKSTLDALLRKGYLNKSLGQYSVSRNIPLSSKERTALKQYVKQQIDPEQTLKTLDYNALLKPLRP